MSRRTDIENWCDENTNWVFPSKYPGFPNEAYTLLEILFFLNVEGGDSKKVKIYFGKKFRSYDELKVGYRYLTDLFSKVPDQFNYILWRAYLNWGKYYITWQSHLLPNESVSGRSHVIRSKVNQDNQKRFF